MAKALAGTAVLCCLLVLLALSAGCRASSYNVSIGLSEGRSDDFHDAPRETADPRRTQRERDTDRTSHDLDGDGIPDTRDTDVDGDGVPNDQDTDDDNDGIPDDQDPDDNDDGIIDDLDR